MTSILSELWSYPVASMTPKHQLFRFGIFELDGSTGELSREGKAQPRLQSQPLQVLLLLLERPRQVVTRDDLRQRLWPSETFVDFDHGLNTAINKLRNALDDSAGNPRFIQTLPRLGYRFIAPVEVADIGTAPRSAPIVGEQPAGKETDRAGSQPARPSLLSRPDELPPMTQGMTRLLFLLIQIMYLSFFVISLMRLPAIATELSESLTHGFPVLALLIVTASVGIPIRLYLISAAALGYRGLSGKFQKLFPFVFVLDELWALAPFLLTRYIGTGVALAATAALLYVPFAQRSLLLMSPIVRGKSE
jgi:cholera toxin transcriptional activator